MALAMSQSLDGTYGQDTFNSKSSIRDREWPAYAGRDDFLADLCPCETYPHC